MGRRSLRAAIPALVFLIAAACGSGSGTADKSTATTNPQQSQPTVTAGTSPTTGPSVALPAAGAGDWPTYHQDVARRGFIATGPSPNGLKQRWASPSLDGLVYTSPLVVGDLVIAATEGNSVYALHRDTGQVAWRAQLGQPMRGNQLPCGNIDPSGITGTPVVDTGSKTVYAVAFVQPGRHDLVGLDLATGQVKFRRAADPSDSPLVLQERGALTIANGFVYVPYGGLFGDCGAYHGWVVASRLDGSGPLNTFQVPVAREGGLWAPAGPSVDAQGNLFVALGNADPNPGTDYGNSVLRLTPDLKLSDAFIDPDTAALNKGDVDLGSISPAVLDGGLVFQAGKAGRGYLLNGAQLGGAGGQAFAAPVCHGAYGATAYTPPRLFVSCVDGLVALTIGPGATMATAWKGDAGGEPGPPIVTGSTVWATAPASGQLLAFDASSGQVVGRANVGRMTRFSTLAATSDLLFVPTGSSVVAFGN